MKKLTSQQKSSLQNYQAMDNMISAADNTLVSALQEMSNDQDSCILTPQEIYPELWFRMNKATVELTQQMERLLLNKTKDMIRSYKLAETKNPIVKEEDRETPPADLESLFTMSNIIKVRDFTTIEVAEGTTIRDRETFYAEIKKSLLKYDENGIYSDITKEGRDVDELFDTIYEIIKPYIEAGFINREENLANTFRSIVDISNIVIATDVFWNVFVVPYDLQYPILIEKYKWIHTMTSQQQSSPMEDAMGMMAAAGTTVGEDPAEATPKDEVTEDVVDVAEDSDSTSN